MGNSSSKKDEEKKRNEQIREKLILVEQQRLQEARRQLQQQEEARRQLQQQEEARRQLQQRQEALRRYKEKQQQQSTLNQLFQDLSIQTEHRQPTIKLVTINKTLISDFLKNTEHDSWTNHVNNSAFALESIEENSPEFHQIQFFFKKTNKKCFKVNEIKKVFNPYLLMQYKLMEEAYKNRYGYVSEKQFFHGTPCDNINGICEYNFDWRLNGRHKFGHGVSFTPISNYATHYSDKTYKKTMIVANVLVSNQCLGNPNTVIPQNDCDTTTNDNEHVFVKYEDNAFYPTYVIHYEGVDVKPFKPRNRQLNWYD